MTLIDYSWIAVIVLLILAVVIERLAKKGQKVIKKTVKDISLSPNDWAFVKATVKKQKTTMGNFISTQLKRYSDEHSR